jgi:AcrR family transcriptional regulator
MNSLNVQFSTARPTSMTDKSDPKETILAAAAARILHYGYAKTTMSEIAADCGMSAGNIYRFFPAKIDIAQEMSRRFYEEIHRSYEEIVSDSTRSPSRRLADFFLVRLERNFQVFQEHPKLMELAEIMGRERPDFLAEEAGRQRRYIEKILAAGVESGDFALPYDLTVSADLVQCAAAKFQTPFLWTMERLDALRLELSQLLILLMTGLSARR